MEIKSHVDRLIKGAVTVILMLAVIFSVSGAYAHPVEDCLPVKGEVIKEQTSTLTIQLSEVDALEDVANFTKLLGANESLEGLRLVQVQLNVDDATNSFVRWTAQIISGTTENIESELLAKAKEEDFSMIHQESFEGYIAFTLNTSLTEKERVEYYPQPGYTAWQVGSGLGFD